MMTQTKAMHLSDLHFEHKIWMNTLKFAQDEINIFEHYLEDLVGRWKKQETLVQLEHYQNQFIKEKEVIDTLLHDIGESEHDLVNFAKKHPSTFDMYLLKDHSALRERMDLFTRIFSDLKARFFRFMAKWK
jgi:hypothetical protein